ncbi:MULTISPECIES: PIN domain-containing protein [unclassified Nodularia (in: cyanobacteria)]|uniref:PIN domain-containing protein n=1 Tax=unclassified Nodularia (in: cyanobacteria) TaxID=2656917 RepID=UPI00187EBB38|nr:PIN domain-containing protein [Nodularia sp. LEGE 06071]MBE9197901.1 DUF4935 domain-containing protein [Nodularia sp. LEGE 06071]MCC2693518.1 DUF4935 domain-containing protein [Nodularia sp. LEGE 04288]
MTTLYIETNFFISFAKNQDQNSRILIYPQELEEISNITIVTPAICYMESLSVLADERRRRHDFTEKLEKERNELKGNIKSKYSAEILRSLQIAKINNEAMTDDIENRLFEVLTWAANNLNLINLEPAIFIDSLNQKFIPDPTDNLILHSILNHAKTSSDAQKVLLTGNSNDFGTKEIKQILGAAGIRKYFASTKDFLGWLQSI